MRVKIKLLQGKKEKKKKKRKLILITWLVSELCKLFQGCKCQHILSRLKHLWLNEFWGHRATSGNLFPPWQGREINSRPTCPTRPPEDHFRMKCFSRSHAHSSPIPKTHQSTAVPVWAPRRRAEPCLFNL